VSGQIYAPATLTTPPPRKNALGMYYTGGWVGPRSSLEISSLLGSEPQLVFRPIA